MDEFLLDTYHANYDRDLTELWNGRRPSTVPTTYECTSLDSYYKRSRGTQRCRNPRRMMP